jgi:hypothetical protein
MGSQSGGTRDIKDEKQALLQYLFWTVVAVVLGYIVIFVI